MNHLNRPFLKSFDVRVPNSFCTRLVYESNGRFGRFVAEIDTNRLNTKRLEQSLVRGLQAFNIAVTHPPSMPATMPASRPKPKAKK